VYRHPSPGLAGDNVPVLAISSGTGFNARVWMPREAVSEVAHAGEVLFQLDNVVLRKFFVGQFRKAEEVPHEDRVIAHFDAKLPIEAITELGARSEPLRVHLLWRPSPLQNVWFRSAILMLLVGLILMSVASLTAHVRTRRNARVVFQGEAYEPASRNPLRDQDG
jgi:hypothetical protein